MPTPIRFALVALAFFYTSILVAIGQIYLDGVISDVFDIIQGLMSGFGMGALFLCWLTTPE